MPDYQTPALILTIKDYGEADRIVTFYTRDFGKISGIAKGAKKSQKRFVGTLELFSQVVLSFFAKETFPLVRINQCLLTQAFPAIHQDLLRLAYGSYLAELINEMIPERVYQRELFPVLLKFFSLINSSPLKEDYLRIFEMRFLVVSGYRPALTHCLECNGKVTSGKNLFFDIPRGGVVCSFCAQNKNNLYTISLGTLKLLEQAGNLTIDKVKRLVFSPQALKESREIIPQFIQYHSGKELQSLKFLKKIKG
ncbi:MAG: DNA repair protein RecO [Desulfobacterota bacterium]|nr:DNA repair protein RecO [Thermodesulfobacteriota bacterium]